MRQHCILQVGMVILHFSGYCAGSVHLFISEIRFVSENNQKIIFPFTPPTIKMIRILVTVGFLPLFLTEVLDKMKATHDFCPLLFLWMGIMQEREMYSISRKGYSIYVISSYFPGN